MTLDRELLQRVGAVEVGSQQGDTALGRRERAFFMTQEIEVEGLLRLNDYVVASLPPGRADPDFQGALGGMFSRVGAMFDFEGQSLTLARRSQFNTAGFYEVRSLGGNPIRYGTSDSFSPYGAVSKMTLERNPLFDRRPIVNAELDGRRLRLLLDTGYAGSVLLYGDASASGAPDAQAWLFGAGPASKIERSRTLVIGQISFANPVVEFVGSGVQPHDSTKKIDGVVGMELLRRVTMFLDLGRESIALRPNRYLAAPVSYNRSGMNITKVGSEILIANVTAQGPAWRAGLRPGDKLMNWEGAASLRALSASCSGRAGTTVPVLAQRGDKTVRVDLVLQELV